MTAASAAPGAVILLYHRITCLPTDPLLLSVRPEHFAAHVEILRRVARPMSLGAIVAAARAGKMPERAVAITFDDGYADNLLLAKPLLHQAQVPATVFVASAGIDSGEEFFWDELDRVFLQPGRLGGTLALRIGATDYRTELGEAAEYSQAQWEQLASWNVTRPDTPTCRHRIYRELFTLFHRATAAQRHQALEQLRQWAGGNGQGRPSHQMMTGRQLRELADGDLVEVGGHTVDHALLAVESCEDQRRQITDGKRALEAALEQPVRSFSYPFGCRRDYTPQSVTAVREAGFDFACANFAGPVTPATDLLQLPRVIVRDWPGETFHQQLEGWLTMPPR